MKAFGYSLSLRAQRDLAGIFLYHADLGNAALGRRLADDMQQKIRKIASSRNAGVARDWISPGLRAFPYKTRCIDFRDSDDAIPVLPILRGRQDVGFETLMPAEEM
jgi:toxin ParE1/3/4